MEKPFSEEIKSNFETISNLIKPISFDEEKLNQPTQKKDVAIAIEIANDKLLPFINAAQKFVDDRVSQYPKDLDDTNFKRSAATAEMATDYLAKTIGELSLKADKETVKTLKSDIAKTSDVIENIAEYVITGNEQALTTLQNMSQGRSR